MGTHLLRQCMMRRPWLGTIVKGGLLVVCVCLLIIALLGTGKSSSRRELTKEWRRTIMGSFQMRAKNISFFVGGRDEEEVEENERKEELKEEEDLEEKKETKEKALGLFGNAEGQEEEKELEAIRDNNELQESLKDSDDINEGSNTPSKSICPSIPPNLVGRIPIKKRMEMGDVLTEFVSVVTQGGSWSPKKCLARWRVAILVPYRNREKQLAPFLHHMHNFLQKQQLNYTIFIIEQEDTRPFNRAKLLNVGFVESQKEGPFDCYVFHDVDLLPEDDRHLYHCSLMPRHLNVAASNNKYKAPDNEWTLRYIGGVLMMKGEHVVKVNGWSNKYWGWGGEDDDMWRRLLLEKLTVWRYPPSIARYTMLPHKQQKRNPDRYDILRRNIGRYNRDGFNSAVYSVKNRRIEVLYTLIGVDLDVEEEDIVHVDMQ